MILNQAVSTACQESSLAGRTLACETISEGRSVDNLVCNSLELASCPGSHVGTGLAWNDTIHQVYSEVLVRLASCSVELSTIEIMSRVTNIKNQEN